MKTSEAYPSTYLSAEDLNGNDVTVTITDVTVEEVGTKKERKLCISMAGKKKQFIVNKTNAKAIEKVLGSDETDNWIGQRITIGPTEVEFQGDMVLSIRVRLKKPVAATATAKPIPPQEEPELPQDDPDSIPF